MIDTLDFSRPAEPSVFTLPLECVLEDRNFNVRIFYGDIDQLAVQLMTEGQHEPIKVRREGTQYFIVDGHRRQRAFARCRDLRIENERGRYFVYEAAHLLREAPGPVRAGFSPEKVQCRQVDAARGEAELFASQLIYNGGKPFTVFERMLFLSRLSRHRPFSTEQLALKTGFSRTHVANALALNAADPRLLDYVRDGRISQKLALRLLRTCSAEEQMARLRAALAVAQKHRREKILPKDFAWGGRADAGPPVVPARRRVDPVRVRLGGLARRMEEAGRCPPNPSAEIRLRALTLIHRYAMGKLSYARLEAFILGRE